MVKSQTNTAFHAADLWPAPQSDGPIDAAVQIPGSKSLTNRWLVLATLSRAPSVLRRPLRARDTELMRAALTGLGTVIEDNGADWQVQPRPWARSASIDCGLAGNVMRFVPAVAGLATGSISFDGDEQARRRPLLPLLTALRDLGVTVEDAGRGSLPFRIDGTGRIPGGSVSIDSSASSQFVSALLLAGCRFDDGLMLSTVGSTPSLPHIHMTTQLLHQAGVPVQRQSDTTWQVPPRHPDVGEVVVEPDLSNALPFLAAALITGGRCRVNGWPKDSVQPIDRVRDIIEALGGHVSVSTGVLEVRAGGAITGADLDMSAVGELVPTVTALATLASSPTTIRGVAHLRGHETDRLAALTAEYSALGADITETADGLSIRPRPLHGDVFHTYHDHRMATAGALTGLVVPGVVVENVATTAKTLPDFPTMWGRMLDPGAA